MISGEIIFLKLDGAMPGSRLAERGDRVRGTIENREFHGYKCGLYLPPGYGTCTDPFPVIYLNGGENIGEILDFIEPHFGLDCKEFVLQNIQPASWQDDYSPWPAPSVMEGGEPFGGNAPNYLRTLVEKIKPEIDLQYKTRQDPQDTVLIGYSLAGLASLFSLYTCGTFGKIACLSGSLWYEGWMEFMESHTPVNPDAEVYISLGRGESRSRNPVLAKVGDCTTVTVDMLSRQLLPGGNVKFEWNNGGHFSDIPQRYQKAILWLMGSRGQQGK